MPELIPMDLIHAGVSKVRYTKQIDQDQVSQARITLGPVSKDRNENTTESVESAI